MPLLIIHRQALGYPKLYTTQLSCDLSRPVMILPIKSENAHCGLAWLQLNYVYIY